MFRFYTFHPDRGSRAPQWPLYSKWHLWTDLPSARYWMPACGESRRRNQRLVVPGERLALVVVLTEEQVLPFCGLPLRSIHDSVYVLRVVRLRPRSTYEELLQSGMYTQWKKEGRLQEAPPVCPSPAQT